MHAMLRGGEGENMILKKANFVTKLIISKQSLLPKYVNTSKEIQAHHHYVVGSRPALEITKRVTRLEAASNKVYQLLAHGR
jgi:quinolinate synthase